MADLITSSSPSSLAGMHTSSSLPAKPNSLSSLSEEVLSESEHTRRPCSSAAYVLATLLWKAGYSQEQLLRNLSFYLTVVAPELGPEEPRIWKSFMTDHFSPLEFSWEWGPRDAAPAVRFSFEPVGAFAGTQLDPLNQFAGLRFVREQGHRIAGCDLQWFHHFESLLSFKFSKSLQQRGYLSEGHQSRMFLGFDILKDGVVLKAYFLPAFKALEQGISKQDLVMRAIKSLPQYSEERFPAFENLCKFLKSTEVGLALMPEVVAVDCVAPVRSRVKIYLRSGSTSFSQVCQVMTMSETGISLKSKAIAKLKNLWALTLGLGPGFDPCAELPVQNHRTAGILYYFEIRPDKAEPTTKVYIPVRHYATNDARVAQGILEFRSSQGQPGFQREYLEALNLLNRNPLHESQGLHTYVGCSFIGEDLKITSYLGPERFT